MVRFPLLGGQASFRGRASSSLCESSSHAFMLLTLVGDFKALCPYFLVAHSQTESEGAMGYMVRGTLPMNPSASSAQPPLDSHDMVCSY